MFEIIGKLFFCWFLADFMSSFFHWWEDQYATEDMPIIGTLISGPNSLHHSKPTAFLNGNYWHRNWTTIIPALSVGVPLLFYDFWFALPFLMVTQANEIHGWSHQKCNRFIRMLQDTEFLASPKHHAKHHVDPFNRNYGVMSGWFNTFYDNLNFWFSIEWVIYKVFGFLPKHQIPAK